MSISDLGILALAVWYAAYVVVKLAGPFGAFAWLRTKGEVFACIYCFSWWVAVAFALIWFTPARPLVYPFSLAGAALLAHRYTGGFMVQ